MKLLPAFCLLILIIPATVNAQHKLRIKNVSVGFQVFELDLFGNNPTTIPPLLKDPNPYMDYIADFNYNEITGGGGIVGLRYYYLNAEFNKPTSASTFWRHFTLEGGLQVSQEIHESAGSIAKTVYELNPEYKRTSETFSLTRRQRFAGLNLAIYRKFSASKRLTPFIGLKFQPGIAIVSRYENRLDSSVQDASMQTTSRVSRMPDLKGKHFYQAQLMIPIGIEWEVKKQALFIRAQVAFGVLKNDFIGSRLADMESHGAGFSVLYVPKKWR